MTEFIDCEVLLYFPEFLKRISGTESKNIPQVICTETLDSAHIIMSLYAVGPIEFM